MTGTESVDAKFNRHILLAPWRALPNWLRNGPFVFLHLSCLAILFIPSTYTALALCAAAYVVRMFGITGGFHRYFSHRAYKTSRFFQFCLAWLGCSALQKGPLWWAAHHRDHHKHSDTPEDKHSPITQTFWYSHIGWVMASDSNDIEISKVRDLSKFWELRWLDQNHWVPGVFLAILFYLIDGLSGLAWGFALSTVILYHGTFTINSLTHLFGKKRFPTTDDSRNHWFLALITLGEGWHNNHHYYQASANQGFYWWEIDISYAILRVMSWFGLVWDLKKPHPKVLEQGRQLDAGLIAPEAVKIPA